MGPAWIIEGEHPERYEQLLKRVAEAVGPADFVDWLLVKDVVALTWEIQRSRRHRETVIRMGAWMRLSKSSSKSCQGRNDPSVSVRPENSLQMAEWRLTGSHPWATIIGEASQIFPLGRRDRAIISSRAHRSRRCRSDGRGDRASRLSEHAERLTECDAIICAGSLTGGAGSIAPRGDEEFAGQPTMAMRRTLALLAPIHA